MSTDPHVTTSAPGAASAGDPPAARKGPSRAWGPLLATIACFGLLAVVYAVTRGEDAEGGARHTLHAPPGAPVPDDTDVFGAPHAADGDRTSDGAPQAPPGCGPLDLEHPPEIAFEVAPDGLDLGSLKQGVKITHDVHFKSVGQGTLCISQVTTGCGCLKATLVGDTKRFAPGESGVIRLAADTTGRVGTIRKQVALITNDAKSPRRAFRVTMDISAGLVSEPRYLQFGNVPPKTAAVRTMYLRSAKSEADWKILGVESMRRIAGREPAAYTFEVEPVTDPRYHKVKLRITHPGYAELGAIRDVIAIQTSHPDRPRVEVPAHIHVVPRILSRSRVVSLGFVQPGVPRAPTRARIQGGSPTVVFSILGVDVVPLDEGSARPGGVGFSARFGRDARGWWVDVSYDGKARAEGLLEAMLVVRTDDPLQPEVRVPIRATVRSRR